MQRRRGAAALVLVLILMAVLGSVMTDPYFDRFSDRPDGGKLERDGGTRPVWRIPAVPEPIVPVTTTFPVSMLLVSAGRRSVPLISTAPFVPPRA